MFSKSLNMRIALLQKIGTKFDLQIKRTADLIVASVKNDGTLFFAGNGGSAAEAQHMSAEYLATLDHRNFRPGIRSVALTTDTSFLTAWTNDFVDDIFLAYSTSGNSHNICKGITTAKEKGLKIIGFSGNDGGVMGSLCDVCFIVPSTRTAQIQEVHTMLGHELCALVEQKVFGK